MNTDPMRVDRDQNGSPSGEFELSVVWLLRLVFENRRILIGIPLGLALLLALFALLATTEYEARSRFITAESSAPPGGISGVAQVFLDLSGAGEPLSFYPELIESSDVLKGAAAADYRILEGEDTVTVSLATLYEIETEDPEARLRAAAGELAANVEVGVNGGARMVVLTTQAERPEIAVQLNATLLELVHAWNLERRQSQARAERQFLEQRLEETSAELRAAEVDMEQFLDQNRRFQQSPELTFEAGRLQRRIDLLQQRYIGLVRSYDEARAQEVRSTPLITVVDQPEDSVSLVKASVVLRVLVGLIAGFLLAFIVVLVREYVRHERRQRPEEYARLRQRVASGGGFFRSLLTGGAGR